MPTPKYKKDLQKKAAEREMARQLLAKFGGPIGEAGAFLMGQMGGKPKKYDTLQGGKAPDYSGEDFQNVKDVKQNINKNSPFYKSLKPWEQKALTTQFANLGGKQASAPEMLDQAGIIAPKKYSKELDDLFSTTVTMEDGSTKDVTGSLLAENYGRLSSFGGSKDQWKFRTDDDSLHFDPLASGNADVTDPRGLHLYGTGLQIGGTAPEGVSGLNIKGEGFDPSEIMGAAPGVHAGTGVYTFTGGTGAGGTTEADLARYIAAAGGGGGSVDQSVRRGGQASSLSQAADVGIASNMFQPQPRVKSKLELHDPLQPKADLEKQLGFDPYGGRLFAEAKEPAPIVRPNEEDVFRR